MDFKLALFSKSVILAFAGMTVAIFSFSCFASAISDFQSFTASTQSGRANFEQIVIDAKGKTTQRTNGTLTFVRPGKFRFQYEKPAQVIVGDGKKVSFFDQDLNQVTVKKFEQAFSNTPAALLAGKGDIENSFTLVASPESDGLNWLDAIPRQKDAGIEKFRLGFAKGQLAAMELNDAFGNRTRLNFSKFERNPKLDAKEFIFVPPKGADVIGEEAALK
jgi:outer membrane lipoprotein carrier protein